MSILILGCVLSGAAGFLAGWWKGRGDFASDLDDDCGDILDRLKRVTTSCTACGSPFVAGCPNRCGPRDGSADACDGLTAEAQKLGMYPSKEKPKEES